MRNSTILLLWEGERERSTARAWFELDRVWALDCLSSQSQSLACFIDAFYSFYLLFTFILISKFTFLNTRWKFAAFGRTKFSLWALKVTCKFYVRKKGGCFEWICMQAIDHSRLFVSLGCSDWMWSSGNIGHSARPLKCDSLYNCCEYVLKATTLNIHLHIIHWAMSRDLNLDTFALPVHAVAHWPTWQTFTHLTGIFLEVPRSLYYQELYSDRNSTRVSSLL